MYRISLNIHGGSGLYSSMFLQIRPNYDYLGNFFLNCVYMLVFHEKDVKTGFVEIVFQRVSNKIIHLIVQTTIAFFNFIAFFDYSDMSLTWTLNFTFDIFLCFYFGMNA
ncbi:hypothetical protein BpHYR1_027842 [Brachionus plicatilis]|uniref:Uncharacterized protein n=1 Tax=Brachionus plicatilis TaxID=10195 RepID=A0A3M7RYW7_BRAPC|nr:hypothetical protein BpHYR1_027842 [Brachionus plicatilis]